MHLLETMAEVGIPLLIHGEVTDKEIDIFDEKKSLLIKNLTLFVENFQTLK